MKTIAPHVARSLLGLVFLVFGLNGFFHFLPMPPPPEGAAGRFLELFAGSYLMSLTKGTEVVVGLLLLSNRLVPLALVVLAPVMVNIVAFHALLAPEGLAMPLVLLALQLYLAWTQRAAFAPLFARPASASRSTAGMPVGGAPAAS